MDPDQTVLYEQSDLGLVFIEEASDTIQQTTKADDVVVIGALRVKNCVRWYFSSKILLMFV